MISAYRRGIFPWYNAGEPVLWWTPDPRNILLPEEFRCSRSLRKRLRRDDYQVRRNCAFAEVVAGCAAPRRDAGGTWIDQDMHAAYLRLHRVGVAHSVEAWQENTLVGGLYGLALGRVFFGESMFSRAPDASKVALAWLCQQGFELIDCQLPNPHLASLGARTVPRAEFEHLLMLGLAAPEVTWRQTA